MKRLLLTTILVALAAGCSNSTDKPGALLHEPGALALFKGTVAHESGSLRYYLAVANVRGDELRLIDVSDDELVESPGLVFPLSIPTSGRPLRMVAADLHDGPATPDALAVIAAGSDAVELVDTWSGHPTVAHRIPLPAEAEVLGMTVEPLPIVGSARLVVALSGGRLVLIELTRDPASGAVVPTLPPTTLSDPALVGHETEVLSFDVASLAPAATPGYVYAASRDLLPGGVYGVARIALPASLAGWSVASVESFDALVPTEAVAAATFAPWNAATTSFDATLEERIVAVPVASACGPGKPVGCGLLALHLHAGLPAPVVGDLAPNQVAGEESHLIPLHIPAPVTALQAIGRAKDVEAPIASGAPTSTTGLGIVAAADGRIYVVDLARWMMPSETATVASVSAAAAVAGADTGAGAENRIGLWNLDGTGSASAADADLAARIGLESGFTPDDAWRLTWEGILPGLDARAAVFGRSGATRTVAVQIGTTSPVAVADLTALGVRDLDRVEIAATGAIAQWCPEGAEVAVSGAPVASAVTLAVPAGNCLESVPDLASIPIVATFRTKGLVLTGAKAGYAGRPAATAVASTPGSFPPGATRRYYLTGGCAGATCAALRLAPALLDAAGNPVDPVAAAPGDLPVRGTAIHFTTASGLVPSGRRPIHDGSALASDLPLGLALGDPNAPGQGIIVYASYTAGLVMSFNSGAGVGIMSIVR